MATGCGNTIYDMQNNFQEWKAYLPKNLGHELRKIGKFLHSSAETFSTPFDENTIIQPPELHDEIKSWLQSVHINTPSHLTAPIAIPDCEEELQCPKAPHRQQGMDNRDWDIQMGDDTVEIALLYKKDVDPLLFDKCIRIRIPVIIEDSSPDILVHVKKEILKENQPRFFMTF